MFIFTTPSVIKLPNNPSPQTMFTKAGVKGYSVGFLFTDNQIVQERFLVRYIHFTPHHAHERVRTVQRRDTLTASSTYRAGCSIVSMHVTFIHIVLLPYACRTQNALI